ncbi:MAG: alpha/beta hydrolase [Cellulomonas sp.]
MHALLRFPVLNPVVLGTAFVLAALVVILLATRRITRWPALAAAGIVGGASTGVLALWLVEDVADVFGPALGWSTRAWVVGCCAALGLAAMNWRRSTVRRKAGSVLGSLVLVSASVLGVNALYGLDPTLGSLIGVATVDQLALPAPVASPRSTGTPGTPVATAAGPLWQTWTAPAGMPPVGTVGIESIPSTVSGFTARPAGIYLPPAALTAHPPTLPLVVLLMGQPGNPDPQYVAAVLDRYAAAHQGLAPIVVVADQLGDPTKDTLCLDTAQYGKIDTYVNKDVLPWAQAHLNVMADRAHTTIAGYSNGGQCAISFIAKYPDLWGNVLDISGEEYPGADHTADVLAHIFKGSQKAYDAQKPTVILGQKTYPDTVGIFTVSTDDPAYKPGAKRVTAAAKAAGMQVTYFEVPNGGHVIGALNGGLEEGFAVLYPRLGLSQK